MTTAVANDRVAVELCAGLGGIGIGLRSLGFHVAKAYDSWGEAVAIYNHNFTGEVAATANLLSEKGRRLVEDDRKRIGDIDLLAAGGQLGRGQRPCGHWVAAAKVERLAAE